MLIGAILVTFAFWPVRREHRVNIGPLVKSAVEWNGANPVQTPSDQSGGLLLDLTDNHVGVDALHITINGRSQTVAVVNCIIRLEPEGRKLLLVSEQLSAEMRQSLRADPKLSLRVEASPPSKAVMPVYIRYLTHAGYISRLLQHGREHRDERLDSGQSTNGEGK